jgi:hypothetical protein
MATRKSSLRLGGEDIPVLYDQNSDDTTTYALRVSTTGASGGGGDASAANQTTLNTYTGALTETAPATDTASSGLNGRLQRIAQRITSLIALVPGSLGQKTSANSFAVTVASDQSAIATTTADGGNTAIGALADAAITSNTTGSLSGKLRGLVAWAYTRMPAALGQTTASASLPVVVASDNILTAGGNTTLVSVTPTVSTSPAYTSGDSVGAKQTIASAVRTSGGTGILQNLTVTDKGNQKAALEILIFDSDPTAGTYTDNGATALSTDLAKVIARISVAATDYITIDSKAVAKVAVGQVVKASGSTSLYAVATTTSTPTYASTTDLTFKYGILQD